MSNNTIDLITYYHHARCLSKCDSPVLTEPRIVGSVIPLRRNGLIPYIVAIGMVDSEAIVKDK